jgi:hypothetical protein
VRITQSAPSPPRRPSSTRVQNLVFLVADLCALCALGVRRGVHHAKRAKIAKKVRVPEIEPVVLLVAGPWLPAFVGVGR